MLYLHIPYCHRKCTYCAFYSAVTSADKQAYVDALCEELHRRNHDQGHPLRTIYFGGGTPSLLSIVQLKQIIDSIRKYYDLSQIEEVTLEANPEDLTPEFLHKLKDLHFVNRLSIGIQSFIDSDLHLLNRRHNAAQSLLSIHNAASAGFNNISIDLIYGLPYQTLADWQTNLRQLDSLPIQHISAYALTIEEGTMLSRQINEGKIPPPQDEQQLLHYHAFLEWTSTHNFAQYEISNFALPGFQARHNSRYWNRTPYLGVGAAAHSFDGAHRRWNIADVQSYINSVQQGPIAHDEEELSIKDAHNEYLMTALRTTAGIEKSKVAPPFATRLNHDIQRYIACGWITETSSHFKPTSEGLLHADGIASELFV